MPEIKKYSTKDELLEADRKYKGKTSVVGMSAMTFPGYINSTRTQMFTSHLKQFLNILHPQFPYVFSGAENTAGDNSTGYKQIKHDSVVVKKIDKFADIVDQPFESYIFIYDKKKEKYKVIHRTENEDLTEDFAFPYNNERLDSLVEGEELKAGDILARSISYDENMNYRYGRNATVIYVLDPYTSEDAAVISKSFSKAMSAMKEKVVEAGMNLNDIPLNLYGDEEHYKVFPEIGDFCGSSIMVTRTLHNDQIFFDMKDDNLRQVRDMDREFCSLGKDCRLLDVEIFCNNDEVPENIFTKQIMKYKKSQDKFYREIYKMCDEIVASGKDYSKEIDDLYVRARDFLDTDTKWVDSNDSCFGNIKFKFKIARIAPLGKGGKFTGRMGNKSVVSRVVEDEDMPFTDTGKRVDVKLNLLAIINRTTGFVPHELYTTFAMDRAREHMAEMKTYKEKEKFLFSFMRDMSEEFSHQMYEDYKTLSKKEKETYIDDVIYKTGMYFHEMPIWEERPIFDMLRELRKKYDFLKPYQMYQRKWGQVFPTLTPMIVGEMYMIRLKQTSERGFSARNEGAVNMKGLPERSYKNRSNTERVSDTAIRSGEFELLTLNTAMSPDEIALWHALYRSSVKGRKDMARSIFKTGVNLEIDDSYDIRTAEIFGVIFKSLGCRIRFANTDEQVRSIDDCIIREHCYDGKVYLMTDYDFFMMKIRDEVRDKIQETYPIITEDELNKKIDLEMESTRRLIGNK